MKKFRVTVDGQTYEVDVEEIASVDNQDGSRAAGAPGAGTAANGTSSPASASGSASGSASSAPISSSEGSPGSGGIIEAPIAGNVFDLKVSVGDKVQAGQVVMILEAMKMENEITADWPGTVTEIKVNKGSTVNAGDPLIILG